MKSIIKKFVAIALVLIIIATCSRISYNRGFKQGKKDLIHKSFYFELTSNLEMYKMRKYIDENIPDNGDQNFISLAGVKTLLSGSLFAYDMYKDGIDKLYASDHELANAKRLEKLNMAKEVTQHINGILVIYPTGKINL